MKPIKTTQWHDCYGKSWNGLITKESWQHPAKYSRALVEHIVDYMLARNWINPNDLVGDPFGGVGLGGIVSCYRGLNWVGVELEPKFHALAEQNFALHHTKLRSIGKPTPRIILGDSRRFHELVAGTIGIVSSPPFATQQTGSGLAKPGAMKFNGTTIGNQGYQNQGQSPGQIGSLKAGTVDGVVSSPPFENCGVNLGDTGPTAGRRQEISKRSVARKEAYGATEGQIGNEKGETYFDAMKSVYSSAFKALVPGGYACWVVKDYCQNGKRVRLCDDTMKLLIHVGFKPVERIQAMLVRETREADMFEGERVTTKARKSFFRRLYESKLEKNDDRRIDWEEILVVKKPETKGNK